MLMKTEIIIGNQSVCIKSNSTRLKESLESVKQHLTLFEKVQDPRSKRFHNVVKAIYYLEEDHDDHYRFYLSKNVMHYVIDAIRHSNMQNMVDIKNLPYKKNKIHFDINRDFVPRENQEMFIEALSEDNGTASYLLDLQPGYGKSLIGTHACLRMKEKFGILVKPNFLEKWVDDIHKYSNLSEDEYYIIKGKRSLLELFEKKQSEISKIKIYVISMRSITNYYNLAMSENHFKVVPENFLNFTGIVNILNDESHKEFEALFKVILWMNPYKLLGLSATMESSKPGVNNFYNMLYPKKDRLVSMFGLNRYLSMYFIDYFLADGVFLPHKTFRGYNHIMFEQAIMKNLYILNDYLDMIVNIIDRYYIELKAKVEYKTEGREKCLIFFSTVDMCTIFTNKLKALYKDHIIKRYVGEDDYNDMLSGDIIVSTPGSCGTGIDIPNLITAIQTVCIADAQLNIQAAGRLREIHGRDVLYISLQCGNIKKHKELKMKRLNVLRDRVKVIHYDKYDNQIGKDVKNDRSFVKKDIYKLPTKKFNFRTFGSKNRPKKAFGGKRFFK